MPSLNPPLDAPSDSFDQAIRARFREHFVFFAQTVLHAHCPARPANIPEMTGLIPPFTGDFKLSRLAPLCLLTTSLPPSCFFGELAYDSLRTPPFTQLWPRLGSMRGKASGNLALRSTRALSPSYFVLKESVCICKFWVHKNG